MERIATSFCSFERLRKRYTYVDKTDMLWRLVSDTEDAMFFLARPRRFGKSLMLDDQKLILGIPNQEVRTAIRTGWFDSVLKVPADDFDALVDVAKRQVAEGNVDGLVNETLYRIYAKIPPEWRIRSEADVKRHFRLFMEMLGAKVAAEAGSARGYADAIVETRKFVWVFEFKFNKSAKQAVRQIREKDYAAQYKGDKRPVTLVGINFRTAKRNIDEPLFATMSS